MITKFEDDSKLGIASGVGIALDIEKRLNDLKAKKGTIGVMDPEFWQIDKTLSTIDDMGSDLPIGSARLWQKQCFEDTKGYGNVNAPDSVSNIKANMRGWKTKRFEDIRVIEREGQTARGFWKGYVDPYLVNLCVVLHNCAECYVLAIACKIRSRKHACYVRTVGINIY